MPLYEYRCACGEQLEVLARSSDQPPPPCPACTQTMCRRVSRVSLSGRATPGPAMSEAPTTWEQTDHGDHDTIRFWRRALDRRAKLEERHPELAEKKVPVLAHEGKFEHAPLHAHPHRDSSGHP